MSSKKNAEARKALEDELEKAFASVEAAVEDTKRREAEKRPRTLFDKKKTAPQEVSSPPEAVSAGPVPEETRAAGAHAARTVDSSAQLTNLQTEDVEVEVVECNIDQIDSALRKTNISEAEENSSVSARNYPDSTAPNQKNTQTVDIYLPSGQEQIEALRRNALASSTDRPAMSFTVKNGKFFSELPKSFFDDSKSEIGLTGTFPSVVKEPGHLKKELGDESAIIETFERDGRLEHENVEIKSTENENVRESESGNGFVLDELLLNLELKRLRAAGMRKSSTGIAKALHKHGERIGSLVFEVLLGKFAMDEGYSKSSAALAAAEFSKSDIFAMFTTSRGIGSLVSLRDKFFFDEKKKRYYGNISSLGEKEKREILPSLISRLLVPPKNLSEAADREIEIFSEKVRRSLSVSPRMEPYEAAAILWGVLSSLLVREIRNVNHYIPAVLRTEGTDLVNKTERRHIEKGHHVASLLKKVFDGFLDELGADELSLLFGRNMSRSEGASELYSMILTLASK